MRQTRLAVCVINQSTFLRCLCNNATLSSTKAESIISQPGKHYNYTQMQGILKGEVSLYRLNQLYDNWQFLFLFANQTNPNQSNRRSMVQWYVPLLYSLLNVELSWCVCRFYFIVCYGLNGETETNTPTTIMTMAVVKSFITMAWSLSSNLHSVSLQLIFLRRWYSTEIS